MHDAADCTADRLEIMDVVNRYGAAIDSRDWPRLHSCFSEDATVTFATRVLEGPDAIVAYIRQATEGIAWQQHLLGSHQVQVVGERGTATCALYATQVPRDADQPARTTIGTYHDEFRRTDAGWKIVRRELRVGGKQEGRQKEDR